MKILGCGRVTPILKNVNKAKQGKQNKWVAILAVIHSSITL